MASAASSTGYSGTPLARKLGLKPAMRVQLIGAPPEWMDWLAPLPAGLDVGSASGPAIDLVHLFATRQAELAQQLADLRQRLRPDAVLWVSWPKKAARVPTDISEDRIRDIALPLGFVDVKVCAVSAVWSGLKLVLRRSLRPPLPKPLRTSPP